MRRNSIDSDAVDFFPLNERDSTSGFAGASPEAEDAYERGRDVVRLIKLARAPEPDPRLSGDMFDVVDKHGNVLASEPWEWDASKRARSLPEAKEIRRRSDGLVMYTCTKPRLKSDPYTSLLVPAKVAS